MQETINNTEAADNNEAVMNSLVIMMVIFFVLGIIGVVIFSFNTKNLLSYIAGAFISCGNILWLRRLLLKLLKAGRFTKWLGIEWGLKVLFLFGSISILVLKAPLNILIFLLGLSILPLIIFSYSIVAYFKLISRR